MRARRPNRSRPALHWRTIIAEIGCCGDVIRRIFDTRPGPQVTKIHNRFQLRTAEARSVGTVGEAEYCPAKERGRADAV